MPVDVQPPADGVGEDVADVYYCWIAVFDVKSV